MSQADLGLAHAAMIAALERHRNDDTVPSLQELGGLETIAAVPGWFASSAFLPLLVEAALPELAVVPLQPAGTALRAIIVDSLTNTSSVPVFD